MATEIRAEALPSLRAAAGEEGKEWLLARTVSKYEGLYREHMPSLIEEIHGIAEGARMSYPYAFYAATRDCMRMDGCTSFVASGGHTEGGRVLMGQTKDTEAPLERFRIMRIVYGTGREMVVLNYPGWIGNLSLTSDGMCFTENSLYGARPGQRTTPGSFLKRLIMERSSVQEVLNTVRGMSFENGCYTIADRSGHVVCLECVSGKVGLRDISGRAAGHANSVL